MIAGVITVALHALAVQSPQLTDDSVAFAHEARVRHELCVRAERREAYRAAYAVAGDTLRSRAQDHWREWRTPSAPLHQVATVPQLAALTRVLRGYTPYPENRETLQRSLDGIDLQVVPGWISPAAEDARWGQAMTVRAVPLFAHEHQATALFLLYWISPEGGEIRARQEQVERGAWVSEGLDFYIRAPLEAQFGTWFLEPRMLPRGKPLIVGTRVAVPVVPGPADFIPDVQPFDILTLAAMQSLGLRVFGQSGRLAAEFEQPAPLGLELAEHGLHAIRSVAVADHEVVLLLTAAGESWNELAFGSVGRAWHEALPEPFGLVVLENSEPWHASVQALLDAGASGVHLIAREDAGVTVLSDRDRPEFGALSSLLVTTRARVGRQLRVPSGVAGVWVEALASDSTEELIEDRPDWLRVRVEHDPLGLDLTLPLVFLDAREARTARDKK